MKKVLCTLCFAVAALYSSAQSIVSVSYVPLNQQEISANPILDYAQPEGHNKWKNRIMLYPDVTFQQIQGLGGCFNEIGGEALAALSQEQQQELLAALFNLDSGSALSFCRASIGSSDFGIDAYSFSEVAEDYLMEHFSLEREKEYMLPYIQKAIAVNPDLRLFASPWSPPGWMKESGFMDRGSETPEKNVLRDEARVYNAYALYFLKYVEGYRNEGVNVERILIQNEQDFHTKYPSCRLPVEQMAHFVDNYMRPLFNEEEVSTEIWAGTFRTAGELEGVKYAASPLLQRNFDGMGIQYTAPQYMHDIKTLAPEMKMMHTECNCFNGLNSWEQAITRFGEVASYINGGCENYAYWNMILNETGESGWKWRQNSLVTINREAKTFTYNPDYAVVSLMSRYIKPGSVRIAAFCQETLISLVNDEGYCLIMQNEADKTKCYECEIDGEKITFEIPAKSLCAVEIK